MSLVYCSIEKFTKDEYGEICSICRKDLKVNESIIKCSSCDSYYHHNHIQEWLKKDSRCPVCKNKLIIVVSEDEEFQNDDGKIDYTKIEGALKEDDKLVLFNPKLKPKISSYFAQILVLIFGFLILNANIVIVIPILIENKPFDFISWLILILALAIFASSLFAIYTGVRNDTLFLSSNWQNIVLTDEKICVNSKKKPLLFEIMPEEIREIRSEIYEDELEIDEEIWDDVYCIHLEIILKSNKRFVFKRLFSNTSSSVTEYILQKLEEYFKMNSSIEISLITEEDKKRKERIRILFIFLGAFFLILILILFSLTVFGI